MITEKEFVENAVQINDGLLETASCANCAAYDKKLGLVFCAAMTGEQCHYGESTGKIRLCVFPPRQPWNVRRITVDEGIGGSRGLLCTAIYPLGDGRVRLLFTVDRGEHPASYSRDYDFRSDTLGERVPIFLRTGKGDLPLDNGSFTGYLASRGYPPTSTAAPIINKVTESDGKLYTAVSLDGESYPILCTIEDRVLVPFAVFPILNTYEFRYYRDGSRIYGVSRLAPDDPGVGKIAFVTSEDGGATWKTQVFPDGIQSRPDILKYDGEPLVVYNYKSERSTENFPPMHHHRNAIRMIRQGKPVFDVFSKYGVVEHETISLCGDLYMVFSNCEQALMRENDAMWEEEGIRVENAKEKSNWIRLGPLPAQPCAENRRHPSFQ